jgi:hypothetical protein
MDHPGFDSLRDLFNKFADKYAGEDLSGRIVRSLAAGGQAAVDKGLQEFPKDYVKQVATDFYAMVTSQEAADGVSAAVRAYDEEKVKSTLDGLVESLKQDENALKLAKSLKDALSKTSTEDLENGLDQLLSSRSMGEKMILMAFFEQAKPFLDNLRNSSEEEIAEQIKEMADTIPTDAIAAQVAAITKEVTPERVSQQAQEVVGKLPSASALSDIVHGVGGAASKALGEIAASGTASTAAGKLQEFLGEAKDIVDQIVANDNAQKNTFKKKGGQEFDL